MPSSSDDNIDKIRDLEQKLKQSRKGIFYLKGILKEVILA